MIKVALLFPGQGSQYVGMGKTLHEKYSVVRETFEEANQVLGFDIRKLCFEGGVCTKNSNWDNKEYQNGVVLPYRRIQEMLLLLEKEGKEPTIEQMQEAVEMLKSVFNTKRTPINEQIERFNQVFNESGTRILFPDFIMPA